MRLCKSNDFKKVLMKDEERSKEDLIKELSRLRRRLTEMEGAEIRHREALDQLRKLYHAIEESPVSVFITDREGVIEYVNPRFSELTGYSLEEVVGQNPRIFSSGKHSPGFYKELWDTVLSGEVWKGEFLNKKKNGELYWEEASISPVTSSNGEITHFIAVKEDITEKRKTEESLKASAGRYKTLFNDSPVALLEYDFSELNAYLEELKAGGTGDFRAYLDKNPEELHKCAQMISITKVNQAAVELYRAKDREELLGGLDKIFSEKSYGTFKEGLIIVASGGTEYETESEIKTFTGVYRDVFMRLRIAGDRSGACTALLAIMDITRRKRAEEALQETMKRLDEAQKVAGIGYYVFDVNTGSWTNSPQLNDILGIDVDYKRDMQGWMNILHPDEREDMARYLRDDVLGRGHEFDRECRIINARTNEQRWVHGLGTLRFGDDGRPVEMFGTIQDITARKRAEHEAGREAETTKHLLRLSEATFRISDIDELMKSVVHIARDIIKVDMVMSYIWDSDTRTLRPSDAAGITREMLPVFKTAPIGLDIAPVINAMDTGRVFMDAAEDGPGSLTLQREGVCDWVDNPRIISLLPLVGKREYQGLIVCVCSGNPGCGDACFTERNRDLMQAVANQVSIALEEARHYKESITKAMELAQKVETIETISSISKAILSTLDIGAIMELTARMVSRLVPCDWLRIIEVDKVREEFKFTAGFGENKALQSIVMPFASTSLTTVLKSRRPEYIANLTRVDSPRQIERELAKEGYMSVLRIPIIVKGDVSGVLGLMARRASAFIPGDLATLEDLSSHVGVALANARLVKDLEEFSIGTIGALARSIDAKSPWTHGHSERVTHIALCIGREISLTDKELNDLRIAGLLHDIGKIGTYESILDKKGMLTEEELREIRKHPVKGAEILAPIRQLTHLLPMIRGHHEFFDGRGYPDGLKGEEIPLQARILAVADTVDAMSADRPYRKGQPQEKIIEELKRCAGTQFDRAIVDAYLKTIL